MKLHFEDNLDYQNAAIAAVADLFKGRRSPVQSLQSLIVLTAGGRVC